jgi:hypothetical protein
MSTHSNPPILKEYSTTPLVATGTLADIEQEVILDVVPKKVVILKGKLIKVPRRPPELGLSDVNLAGLPREGEGLH